MKKRKRDKENQATPLLASKLSVNVDVVVEGFLQLNGEDVLQSLRKTTATPRRYAGVVLLGALETVAHRCTQIDHKQIGVEQREEVISSRVCVRACVRVCVRACVCVCACVRVHVCACVCA